MQVKQLKQEGLLHELEITVDAKEIDSRVDTRLKEVGKTVKLPGFRPGKVPLNLLKKRYGKAILGEILEIAVNESSRQAMEEQDIQPAIQPQIEVKSFDEGKDLTYTMSVEVLPKIEIKDYKGLKLEKPVAKADDKEIDDALARIASSRKSSKPIEGDRKSKEGDILVIDFKGRTAKDNVEHQGMAAEGHHLELGSNTFIPGFEDQLVGVKGGSDVEVKVSFPEEYPVPELAGEDAIFDVEVHEIREPVEAEIDEEFAKSLGMEDVESLRKAVAEQLNVEMNNRSRMIVKKNLLDQLDDAHDFEIPAGMKEQELNNIIQQVQADNQQRGGDPEAELSDEEKEELEEIANRRVRLGLVLAEIGKDNNIQVSDQELQQAVISEAQKYPGQEKEVFDYFSKHRQALEALRAPLYEDKVIDFILELADVTEKEMTSEELMADEEDELESTKKESKKKSSAKKTTKKAKKSEEKSDDKKKPAKKSTAKKKKASE